MDPYGIRLELVKLAYEIVWHNVEYTNEKQRVDYARSGLKSHPELTKINEDDIINVAAKLNLFISNKAPKEIT